MTITIELPDDLAARATAAGLGADLINSFATAGAVAAVLVATDQAETEEDAAGAGRPSPGLLAALKTASVQMEEDARAGRPLAPKQADAQFEATVATHEAARAARIERQAASSMGTNTQRDTQDAR